MMLKVTDCISTEIYERTKYKKLMYTYGCVVLCCVNAIYIKESFSSSPPTLTLLNGRISANGARRVEAEPFIDTFSMEAMVALRYASQNLFRQIFRQTDRADGVFGLRQPTALA